MVSQSFLVAESVPMTSREIYLTPEGLKHLKAELDHLRNVRRKEVAERIHDASETGGTVDNAEYDEAKNEQSFVEGRVRELESILSNAVVAPDAAKRGKGVKFGSSVTVVTDDGSKRDYTVVGSAEASPLEGRISNESPVGSALLGRKVGDKVKVQTPSGVMKLTIRKIR